MTDRIFALSVVLDEDVRADDIKPLIAAIKMLRHVQAVQGHVTNMELWAAEERARMRLVRELWMVLEGRCG